MPLAMKSSYSVYCIVPVNRVGCGPNCVGEDDCNGKGSELISGVRAFRISDAARVAELERACNSQPWAREDLEKFAVEADGAGLRRVALVAHGDAGAVGYAFASAIGGEAEILVLGVDPAHRRAGIGAALLAGLLRELRAIGCEKVFLEARGGNEAALALYQRTGFKQTGLRRGYYSDTGEDAVAMRLEW